MHTVKEFNELGLELEESLYLRFVPIALKVLYSRDEVPEGCYIPSRDRNEPVSYTHLPGMMKKRNSGLCKLQFVPVI